MDCKTKEEGLIFDEQKIKINVAKQKKVNGNIIKTQLKTLVMYTCKILKPDILYFFSSKYL